MIPLVLKIDQFPTNDTIVARLNYSASETDVSPFDAQYLGERNGALEYDFGGVSLRIHHPDPKDLDKDVILISGRRNLASRLIRAQSKHNTLMVTEQCDQLCIMCSQPPKKLHYDLFPAYLEACRLAPIGMTIGISGGEPTLYKDELYEFLITLVQERPDLIFHVLTNAQHFAAQDIPILRKISSNVIWGVPIYSSDQNAHDRIVGKKGAFANLEHGIEILSRSGSVVELRTVVLNSNAEDMERLSKYISLRVPSFSSWALMQMENIGFAKRIWSKQFLDSSLNFEGIAQAIDLATGRGHQVSLYNFPLCTVPDQYRRYCVKSISDWKSRYLSCCGTCAARSSCGGFFEWYDEANGFSKVGLNGT